MKTAVVILNWNGEKFLRKFLPGLAASVRGKDAEVIVADNASTDGSMRFLEYEFPKIRTIRFSRNYGFTGGYNRALFQTESEYFVLINSDIEVTEGWLDPLVEWMDTHPECGICAPKLHSYHEKDKFEYAGAAGGYIDRFGYPFCRGRVLKKVEKDTGQYDNPVPVFWASGACLMIRSGLYRMLGGLDERFFAHQEEIDLCWRVQLAGYTVVTVPGSTVWHVGGGTLPSGSPWKLYLNFRNNLLMLQNNLAATYALDFYRDNPNPRKAAEEGIRLAAKTIRQRMVLDGCAAAVYLATFRFRYFNAVIKAHRDFRKMGHRPDPEAISGFVCGNAGKATVRGFYRKWMVPRALAGKKIKFENPPEDFSGSSSGKGGNH